MVRTALVGLAMLAASCSHSERNVPQDDTAAEAAAGGSGGPSFDAGNAGTSAGLGGFGGGSSAPPVETPDDFVETETGGYKLGPALTGEISDALGGQVTGTGCSIMVGVVRDFRPAEDADGHPDFDAFDGRGATKGLVASELGADGKPVYASQCESEPDRELCPHGQQTTSREDFDTWYRTSDGINLPFAVYLSFAEQDGVYTFESNAFFPLDDAGFGNSDSKHKHNFGFTTELHTTFKYEGGEHFTFTGDDDLWVFVNGKLAIDLGGLHPSETEDLDLDMQADDLGLETGQAYALDLFHAERHFASSNFRVDTTLAFTECGLVGPD